MRSADEVRSRLGGGRPDVGRRGGARRERCPRRCSTSASNGEWSFVETVRHLLFADDIWVGRMLSDEPGDVPPARGAPHRHHGCRRRRDGSDARGPTVVRGGRGPAPRAPPPLHRAARRASPTPTCPRCAPPSSPPDWGEESFPVLECLTVVVREHADHLRFAQRDLAELEAR